MFIIAIKWLREKKGRKNRVCGAKMVKKERRKEGGV